MPIREGARSVHERSFTERVLSLQPPVYVVAPSPALLAELTVQTFQNPPVNAHVATPIRVVTTGAHLTELEATFRAGHQAAELASRDVVAFRTVEEIPVDGTIVVAADHVSTVVSFGSSYGLFEPAERCVASMGTERAKALWKDGDQLQIDRPSWRSVSLDLADRTGDETQRAFVELLEARRGAPVERTLDIPTLALLAGARTDALQKGIAGWCQSQSIAAASTVSTRKSALCERGLVEVRPDPMDSVGAPVHRLTLADEHLDELSTDGLYDVAVDNLPDRFTQ